MPELPDVEFVRRRLTAALRGGTITSARSKDLRLLRPQSPAAFTRGLVGRTVREVRRRGKWLCLELDDGTRLFSHLGMTGWWHERGCDAPEERSERARIDVRRGKGRCRSLRYVDSRRFGRLMVARDDIPEWRELGQDPFAKGIHVGTLAAALASRRRAVKEVLMDQMVLAGIGNILATEGLWRARVDPRSRSDALSRADVTKIARGLEKAIRRQLATRKKPEGEWQDVFAVYGRSGEPCPRCGSTIARVVIGGRATAFCKGCQVRSWPRARQRESTPGQ